MGSHNLRKSGTAKWLAAAAGLALSAVASGQTVFYFENFDSAVLNQQSGDPRVTNSCISNVPVFTHNPPAGWTWDGCGVPSYACRVGNCPPQPGVTCGTCGNIEGIREWEGWSFANKDFWVRVAEDQNRSQFTLGVGNVAIADPDEWDDRGNPDINCGKFNTWMGTPSIDISNAAAGSVSFKFDSSWRPEGFDDLADNNQTAIIRAYYTVGGVEQEAVEVLRWDSDELGLAPGEFFKPDATNETVVLTDAQLVVPPGATSVRFDIGLVEASNDWWWAIDNLELVADVGGEATLLFTEDFESVTLEPPVHEVPSGCGITYCGVNTFTHDGPNGITVSVANPASGGVPDWFGWSFVERSFWTCASGGPNGTAFTNSSGIVAVADGDEYDDLAHEPGVLDTMMETPDIDISARAGSVLVLSFDSSWRFESGQTVSIQAQFNDGSSTQVEVLRWESDQTSAFFKGDAVNERVVLAFTPPADASTVSFSFRYIGGNNWWWAVDNISVFEGIATVSVASNTPTTGTMSVAPSVDYAPCFTPWSPVVASDWTQSFDPIGTCPTECGRPEWRGWAVGFKDWWSTQVDAQLREAFDLGTGYVAIADADEWDDFVNGRSNFNAFMTTPLIALPGSISDAQLQFASSWRPEGFDDACSCDVSNPPFTNNQTAKVKAIYTVGDVEQPAVEVMHWNSDDGLNSGTGIPSPFFKPDSVNELVQLDLNTLNVPAGATGVRFEFSLTNARNDWWWAIDNVVLNVNGAEAFREGFENAPALAAAPTENPPVEQCAYYSSVAAQGGNLAVDNSLLTNCTEGDDYYGFNAWIVDAWARNLGGLRGEHLAETAYISDLSARSCGGTARLVTPNYGINAINPGTLELSFRSGWVADANHVSRVEASFDGGAYVPVLTWNTGNKTTTTDEVVTVSLNNAQGSSTVRLRFSDSNSGWWAISDLQINGQVGFDPCPTCPADYDQDGGVTGSDVEAFFIDFEAGEACADVDLDGGVTGSDVEAFFILFESGGC